MAALSVKQASDSAVKSDSRCDNNQPEKLNISGFPGSYRRKNSAKKEKKWRIGYLEVLGSLVQGAHSVSLVLFGGVAHAAKSLKIIQTEEFEDFPVCDTHDIHQLQRLPRLTCSSQSSGCTHLALLVL